jgi:hypothetical protein
MTVNDIAKRLLTHFSPEERDIPDSVTYPGRNAAVLQAINGALQELFGKGGPWIRKDERGARIYPATSVNVAATENSQTAHVFDWADWMLGCSIAIGSSNYDNTIKTCVAASAVPNYLVITGTLTSDGSAAVTFPTLIHAGTSDTRPKYTSTGSQSMVYSGEYYTAESVANTYLALRKYVDGSIVAEWRSSTLTDLFVSATGWTAQGSATGTPVIAASRSVTLTLPHPGTTGFATSTIYHDSVTIGDDVLEVLEPVRLDRRPLSPTVSPHHQSVLTSYDDYGAYPGSQTPLIAVDRVADTAGVPVSFYVHTWIPDANTPSRTRMRLTPAPSSAGMLDYQAMIAPPVVTSLAATNTLPIPLGMDESVFMPVATMHLMATSFFRSLGVPAAVQKSYDTAMELLAGSNPGKPNQVRFVTRG